MTIFCGLVWVTWLRSFGSTSGTVCVTTGMVIRKMISSTNITSTSGVVLMADTTSSSPSEGPTLIAMVSDLGADAAAGQQHAVQVAGEVAYPFQRPLVAGDQEVVAQHGRHRGRQTDRGHDQRLADGARHLVDRCLAGDADGGQRVIDAPHR